MDIEKRIADLEKAVQRDDRITKLERGSIRFTAFILLELALLGVIIWSIYHLVHFVRSAAS